MTNQCTRTMYWMTCLLPLILSFVICCHGKSFDWGNNMKQRYGIREEENNEVFTQDVRMPGVARPDEDDVYMCTSVQMPRRDAYVVGFEPHATMRTAHHMLLYGCSDITSSPGTAYKCGSMGICKGNSNIMFAWARDAPPPSIPTGVGFHVGGQSRINYVTIQIHYGHRDAFKDEELDTSGLKLTMTFTPQPYLAGIYLLVSGEISVPPHAHNYHVQIACEYNGQAPIYPFAFRTHSHDLGKVISGFLIEGHERGTWKEIAKGDPNWPQAFYPMTPGIVVQQGDWLTARCTYDSDREEETHTGSTGEDEMCNLYLMYYTDADTGKPFDVCGMPASGDIEAHYRRDKPDLAPAKMPDMIEQPPAGQPYYPYGTGNEDYYTDYYNQGIYSPNNYNGNDEDTLGWDPDRWKIDDGTDEDDDDEDADGDDGNDDVIIPVNTKTETEKPIKDDDEIVATTAPSSGKSTEEENENMQPEEDIGSGKLTLSDWHTDDSVTLGQVAGLAVDDKGNIHVFHRRERIWDMQSFDSMNKFTQADDGAIINSTVIAFHPDTGKVIHQWGAKSNNSDCLTCFNGFYLPHGLSIDHEGNLWLTDVALHQVFKFPAGGADTPLITLGEKLTPGTDKDHFCKPADVVVDPKSGNFFVADGYCNSRIMKFSPQGDFLMEWGKMAFKSSGYPSDAFIIPHSITYLEHLDVVCVADREHGRIQCFDSGTGNFVESFQRDVFGGRVFAVHYNPWNGGVLYAVNGPSSDRAPVQGFTLDYNSRQVLQTWKPNVEFQNPHDVECTADNTAVYVAEIGPNKVWKFDVDVATPSMTTPSMDVCQSNPCSNHGTCVSSGGSNSGFYCFCASGFFGNICQNSETFHPVTISTEVCHPNPCQNQGTCFQSAKSAFVSYFCLCASEFHGGNCQHRNNIVTPAAVDDIVKEGTTNDITMSHKSTKAGSNGQVVKSLKTEEAVKGDIMGDKVSGATDANTATTAIIVAVLAVPIVLMMMVAVAVRLRAQGKMKFGESSLQKGYNSTSRFSLGNFFNRRRGFNQVSTEDSDLDGGMDWSEESDIEEYSSLNGTKVSQNL